MEAESYFTFAQSTCGPWVEKSSPRSEMLSFSPQAGQTPLEVARQHNNPEVALLLTKASQVCCKCLLLAISSGPDTGGAEASSGSGALGQTLRSSASGQRCTELRSGVSQP